MTKYKFTHLIFIITSVILPVVGLLWFFYNNAPTPYPNEEYYILLAMYISILVSTGIIFKTKNIRQIHRYIGFRSTKFKPIALAIVIAFLIWGFDYFYQTVLLDINNDIAARDWYETQNNLILAFFGTVIFAPIIEEMLFRGIILQGLNTYLSRFWSAIILSVAFALIHFDVLQIPTLIFASIIYAWLTFKYNSITPAIIAHVTNNCLTYFYYIHINGI